MRTLFQKNCLNSLTMTSIKLKLIISFLSIISVYGSNAGYPGNNVKKDLISEANNSANVYMMRPTNKNSSIQYHLYTPEHPNAVCYFEPKESNSCEFNTGYEFKILIHGFTVQLLPGNVFEQIKDTLLNYNKYNVIIVNWTKYDGHEMVDYAGAVELAYQVGIDVGKMINFLVTEGVNPLNVHIIGHSLGAHAAGVAGKQVSNLGRVTGLDPAGPLYSKAIRQNRLTDTSAILVDVIHTSNYKIGVGFGLHDAIGSIDFYPNGGNRQPACQMGGQYYDTDGKMNTITSTEKLGDCYHDIALSYFMNSIRLCNYASLKCVSYRAYSAGRCDANSDPKNRMGFFCKMIPGLPTKSRFYLNTTATPPYCKNGKQGDAILCD